MSSVVIPKEQLTAFERWELASFDHPADHIAAQEEIERATAAELAIIHEQAHQEGYAAGQQAGHQAGYEAGQQAGYQAGYAEGSQQAQAEAEKIHVLLQKLHGELNQLDQQVAQSLLDLSLEVAKKMVHTTLRTNPEVILNIVSEAIGNLPHFNQNAHLLLHPDDAELVRKQMGEHLTQAGWKIFSDMKLQRGECRVETASSQIDGSLETRWKRIVESIGQDSSWLA